MINGDDAAEQPESKATAQGVSEKGLSAFPFGATFPDGTMMFSPGMTLRDFFAAHALSGLGYDPNGTARGTAEHAYTVADEMLAVRDIDPEEWAERP